MDRVEFGKCMAMLTAAIGKPMAKDQAQVYFDLLSDLPLEKLQAGVTRALAEHEFATIPSIALIRRLSLETGNGSDEWAAEWAKVTRLIRTHGLYRKADALQTLQSRSQRAIEAIGGWEVVCDCETLSMSILGGQFRKAFESLQNVEAREKNFAGIGVGHAAEVKLLASSLKGIE